MELEFTELYRVFFCGFRRRLAEDRPTSLGPLSRPVLRRVFFFLPSFSLPSYQTEGRLLVPPRTAEHDRKKKKKRTRKKEERAPFISLFIWFFFNFFLLSGGPTRPSFSLSVSLSTPLNPSRLDFLRRIFSNKIHILLRLGKFFWRDETEDEGGDGPKKKKLPKLSNKSRRGSNADERRREWKIYENRKRKIIYRRTFFFFLHPGPLGRSVSHGIFIVVTWFRGLALAIVPRQGHARPSNGKVDESNFVTKKNGKKTKQKPKSNSCGLRNVTK